eukprot:4243446-Alexandrium_andersonii.AAC.1
MPLLHTTKPTGSTHSADDGGNRGPRGDPAAEPLAPGSATAHERPEAEGRCEDGATKRRPPPAPS